MGGTLEKEKYHQTEQTSNSLHLLNTNTTDTPTPLTHTFTYRTHLYALSRHHQECLMKKESIELAIG